MTSIREVLVQWVSPNSPGATSVIYMDGGGGFTIANQRLALKNFLQACANFCAGEVTFTIATEGKVLEDTDGSLVGTWVDSTVQTGAGGAATDGAIPTASQMLVRWATAVIRNNRIVKGHTFIPGISEAYVTDGVLSGAVLTAVNSAAATLVTAGQPCIWSRPRPGVPGARSSVTAGSAWSQLAVLRRRRG